MLKIRNFIICIFILYSFNNSAHAQSISIYFQRSVTLPNSDGLFSTIPVNGKASDLTNIINGLLNTTSAGVVYDGIDSFYISDLSNNQILKVDKSGNSVVAVSTDASISLPKALAFDSSNKRLFIMDGSNQQIVRADMSGTFPINSVDIINSDPSITGNLVDMKFNQSDQLLYWSNNGNLYRAEVNPSVSLPVTPNTILRSTASDIRAFDFDGDSPQNIYFADNDTLTGGIYKSVVPDTSTNRLNESVILNLSGNPSFSVAGIVHHKQENVMCYSANDGGNSTIRCGDSSDASTFTEILRDDNTTTILNEPPSFIEIEGSSPTPVPTATSTPQVVRPNTVPQPPAVEVNLAGSKPSATLVLEEFSGANTKKESQDKLAAWISELKLEAKKAKIGFRYQVELKRITESDGSPISGKKNRDLRKITSKRNVLTVKNLKTNSNYSVKYRVEITSKVKGADLKVVKRTKFSPSSTFNVP